MKTRKTRWYHKLCYRISTPYRHDVEQALKAMLHTGIGIGMRYGRKQEHEQFCDQCGTEVLAPDAVYCRICGTRLPLTGPQPHVTRTTGHALRIPPGALATAYHQAQGGPQTRLHAAISKVQLVGMTTQPYDKVS
jgi:hypothetical protein